MRKLLFIAAATLFTGAVAFGQSNTGNTTLNLTVAHEASISVDSSDNFSTTGSVFNPYTATTNFTYKIRTTKATGTGTITTEVTTDFSPTGGPSVTTPPTAGDALTYSCTVASPGTGCSGTQTASTSSATSVATFGADAHSTAAGNSGSVAWSLTNDPVYGTGAYTATVTFTISAT